MQPSNNLVSPPDDVVAPHAPDAARKLFPAALGNTSGTESPLPAHAPGDASDLVDSGGGGTGASPEVPTESAPSGQQPLANVSKQPPVAKNIKWTEACDLCLLTTINSLGAFKEIGHGKKGPAFVKVYDQCVLSSIFAPVKHLLNGKKCADRFDRLVKEHRVRREQDKNKTGTDDEVVSERTQILDDIIDFVYDAKENYQSAASKKRDLLDTLVAAGQEIRQNAMTRGPRGKKRKRKDGSASDLDDAGDTRQPSARPAAVLQDSDDDGTDHNAPSGDKSPPGVATTPTGGQVVVTPARARGTGDEEMEMMIAADQREEKKLQNEQARLEIDREGLQTQKQDLELRREQQALARIETEARIALDRARAEEEKKDREQDRAERKAQAEQNKMQAQENAKVLNALVNLLSREKE